MAGAANNSGIRDNHRRGLVADFLKAKVRDGSRLSVVSAYFPDEEEQARDTTDFDLVTWLVIRAP